MTQYSYIPDEKALEVGDSINTSVAQIALQKVKVFKEEYLEMSPSLFESQENRNGLSHTGEFGRFREKLVQNLLQQFLPARGFVAQIRLGQRRTCGSGSLNG